MLRIRRYRYFVAFAVVLVFILYRVSRTGDRWDDLSTPLPFKPLPKAPIQNPPAHDHDLPSKPQKIAQDEPSRQKPVKAADKDDVPVKIPTLEGHDQAGKFDLPTTTSLTRPKPTVDDSSDDVAHNKVQEHAPEPTKPPTIPAINIPDRKTPQEALQEQQQQQQAQVPFGNPQYVATTTQIHWSKQPEHFPVAKESIIPLPTGKPKAIPRVQHVFGQESEEAKAKRLLRLSKVKAEMERAWGGYKKYAWMHDELSPISKAFRDPFCGWAATMVDALDTLWIMGMKEDFEEAVKAIGTIDFTFTDQRSEIPVFETTIRYLGGLLGAYDVSGGKKGGYTILLDKAVELAEILMGVFDTPNRMPILYYNWKPAFASQPHRAANGVSIAELGSLLMEFTRLAQITKENKYFDAVERITDALVDWQSRGTTVPGIFPERVDASGCNRTAATNAQLKLTAEAAEKIKNTVSAPEDYTGREYDSTLKPERQEKPDSLAGLPQGGKKTSPSTKQSQKISRRSLADDAEEMDDRPLTAKKGSDVPANKPKKPIISPPDLYQEMMVHGTTGEPYEDMYEKETCYPQGLTTGSSFETYSMGGSQDSTYEYFPKTFLLLGGLEPKYKKLHMDTVDAVKKWLLYRPMVPNDRDILFSAKLSTTGNPEKDASITFEATHLTCFLGGMFGLGGKIFDDDIDVAIGEKLADGCVWAYESTASGIMPEGATVVPCRSADHCQWNETLWHEYLDPMFKSRDSEVADWEKRHAEIVKAKKEASRRKAEITATSERASADSDKDAKMPHQEHAVGGADSPAAAAESSAKTVGTANHDAPPAGKGKEKEADWGTLRKRGLDTADDLETSSNDNSPPSKTAKKMTLEDSLDINTAGGTGKVGRPLEAGAGQVPLAVVKELDETLAMPDPPRPFTHKEYVQYRLENEIIPPGYVSINSKNYILRPEAIESVWYMYRITGDTKWQDKGWRMFESIIKATQTESGHSAIRDVLVPISDRTNEMESFWPAETLKYFYLLYSKPDVVSLDDYVLNTEAHPFLRPDASVR
ncbi:glycoside hydrolase family 47 protein [Apiospora rasikravindrae]|uniref:alpha-1,2-Mannosidase n=1 Tax=Apiospora rasikravindrae TaxID=990691 RepID=A0ABR1RXX1_9PEZI